MKKVGKVLLSISAIVSLVITIALGICMILFPILAVTTGFVPEAWKAALDEIAHSFSDEINSEGIAWIIKGFAAGIFFFAFLAGMILRLIVTIFTFKGVKQETKASQVACIVIGAISSSVLTLAGAILGLIGLSIEGKKAEEEKPVEAEEVKEEALKEIEEKK